jgi:hypothetical protein
VTLAATGKMLPVALITYTFKNYKYQKNHIKQQHESASLFFGTLPASDHSANTSNCPQKG